MRPPDRGCEYDRGVKVPRYAHAGIPEVWVVDLRARAVDVYRQPAGDAYRDERRAGPGESLAVPGVQDQQIAIDDVLG